MSGLSQARDNKMSIVTAAIHMDQSFVTFFSLLSSLDNPLDHYSLAPRFYFSELVVKG